MGNYKKILNEGYKIFNLGSIKSMDKDDSKYNFKMGFGGKVYETVGTYDLVINKWLYPIIKGLDLIIGMFKNIDISKISIKKSKKK